jgi:hypothetical protein
MAHAPPEKLSDLEDVLAEVRGWKGVVEKSFACFYLKSQGFLHFHVKGDERWADARQGKDWGEAIPIALGATKAERQRFLKRVWLAPVAMRGIVSWKPTPYAA